MYPVGTELLEKDGTVAWTVVAVYENGTLLQIAKGRFRVKASPDEFYGGYDINMGRTLRYPRKHIIKSLYGEC